MSRERGNAEQALRAWAERNRDRPRGKLVSILFGLLDAAEARERETAGVLKDLLEDRGLDRLLEAARKEGRRQGAEEMRERAAHQADQFWPGRGTVYRTAVDIRALPLPGDAPVTPPAAARR
jgi:hypothetical protein